MARPLIAALVVAVVVPALSLLLFTVLRKLRNPEKSLFLCFLNVALLPLQLLRLGPFKQGKLTLDKAMKYAMKKTKLSDFGDLSFVENYKTIAESSAAATQQLTPVGYFSYRIELNMTMVRRLMHVDYVKRCPEVLGVTVRQPVFVLGMPRTGTTFLHRLLSLDPAVRAPLTWELLSPVPRIPASSTAQEMTADLDKRRSYIKKLLDTRQAMGDKALQHIHEIGFDLPEECLLALTDEVPLLLSLMFPLFFHSREYLALGKARFVQAYAHYKQVLQMLSFQAGERGDSARRWVLKCPAHLLHIQEIKTVFPDAKIIWTHRHPVSAITSMCSLLKALHMVYYEPESRDDAKIGWAVKNTFEKALNQCADDLKAYASDAQHVIYEDLVRDPIATVRGIYAQCGWAFTAEYEQILVRFLAEDKEKRDKVKSKNKSADALHAYTPEQFSLTAQELSTGEFATYVERFNIPAGKN